MKTLAKKQRANPYATCQCGCETDYPFHRMEFGHVHPEARTPELLLKSHITPRREEMETLKQLTELVMGLRAWPIHRRFKARGRVFTLARRLRLRLHGEEHATREAKRAAFLAWAPVWIGELMAEHWSR